jgi:NAD(P)-dependent dehydrogenase (short-subunit alcohol dehydrogenase family)
MMMKTVLITGASRGIGRGLSAAFARAGYAVAINCLREEAQAQAAAEEARAAGAPAALVLPCDVRDSLKVRQMIDRVAAEWGRVDVLVNNAGVTRDRTILKMTNGEWNDVVDTNLSGVFWCLREAARVMTKAGAGSILNVASVLAYRPSVGTANYAAAKAGVIALTKAAARELGRFQVRVNALLPGFHPTDMGGRLPPKERERVLSEHALGRATAPADLARMALAIAENESVSGQVFNVDSRIVA